MFVYDPDDDRLTAKFDHRDRIEGDILLNEEPLNHLLIKLLCVDSAQYVPGWQDQLQKILEELAVLRVKKAKKTCTHFNA